MSRIRLLDCTLRDGGFINDWEFGHDDIVNIFERSVSAGVDIIEVGFIDERRQFDKNRTIMPDGKAVNEIFEGLDHGNAMVVGMIDYGTCSADKILPAQESIMDGIRVIFKKKNRHEAIAFCAQLKEKGYQMFVQPVSITGYEDEEMEELVDLVNDLHPHAMSIVDTYGLLHQSNLMHYFELIDRNLSPDIGLGYHAHNNFQLGYSNAITLMENSRRENGGSGRPMVIDGSAFGMGKGAGNAPIELLAMYMNEHFGTSYDINQILETIDVNIMKTYLKSPWGYSLKYYLAASNDCHPNYVQHLMQKRTLSVKSINEILATIAPKEKLAYNAAHIEEMYLAYQANDIRDEECIEALKDALTGQKVLILGPGESMEKCKDRIFAYVAKEKPVVIAINYNPEDVFADYIFVTNAKRYTSLESGLVKDARRGRGNGKIIATSNVTKASGTFDFRVDYSGLIDPESEIPDSSLLMLLKLFTKIGVKDVVLAGFDGYSQTGHNYFDVAMQYAFVNEKADMLNVYTKQKLAQLSDQIHVTFLTPSKYQED